MSVIDSKQAEANDYNLSPSRYISNGETKALREIPEIVKELAALMKDEANLHAVLKQVLAQLLVPDRPTHQSRNAIVCGVIPARAGIQELCTRTHGQVAISQLSFLMQTVTTRDTVMPRDM